VTVSGVKKGQGEMTSKEVAFALALCLRMMFSDRASPTEASNETVSG
jgi:hypothetical protein